MGEGFSHSKAVPVLKKKSVFRLADKASHMIHMNIKTETKEIKEPSEETTFQVVKASG